MVLKAMGEGKAPEVCCALVGKMVPVWHCLGSFWQGRKPCQYCGEVKIHYGVKAEVDCQFEEPDFEYKLTPVKTPPEKF